MLHWGVDSDMVDTFGRVLQLRFVDGQLVVQSACLDVPDFSVVGTVQQCLLSCWRIQKFTEGRWRTVGAS